MIILASIELSTLFMQTIICIINSNRVYYPNAPPIRPRILETLQSTPAASAAALSRVLGVGASDIRQHLSILLNQASVTIIGQRPAFGRGRPAQLYALTQPASPNNLEELAASLLAELLEGQPPADQPAVLRRLARRLSASASPASKNPTQRLYAAIHQLNAMNYRAQWEARSDAPTIMLGRCPYETILPAYPQLCQLDALLLEELTGLPADQLARLAVTPQGLRQCVFRLGNKARNIPAGPQSESKSGADHHPKAPPPVGD
jgi:predicted ArsR family transcriptional regulator